MVSEPHFLPTNTSSDMLTHTNTPISKNRPVSQVQNCMWFLRHR